MKRILVSKEVMLQILNIGERQLSNLVSSDIIEKIEDRYNLIPSLQQFIIYKGAYKNASGNDEVDTETLGSILGISGRTVIDLAQKGILVKLNKNSYEKDQSVKNYIEYLIERFDKNSQGRDEELKKKMADRKLKEMKLQEEAKELHRTETVVKCVDTLIITFRAAALALPSKLSGIVTGETDIKKVEEIIKSEVHNMLKTLSEWELKDE